MSEAVLASRAFSFPAPKGGKCDALIIAGEHSGDEQAARMLKDVLSENPELQVCAFGGVELDKAGAQLLFDMTAFSVVGLMEVLKNYSFFKALSKAVADWIETYRPKVVCFVDYPGFNLHIAAELQKRAISLKGGGNVKLAYYISPQIWAWKAGRRFKMAKLLDELAVIFPFEKKCYADTTLSVNFVGHPFLEDSYAPPVKRDDNGAILLLPGSRSIAVRRIFPIMLSAMKILKGEKAAAIYPTEEIGRILKECLDKFPELSERVNLLPSGGNPIMAKAVMMSSGTMSLSCCLEGIPGAIVYKANPFTYIVGRSLVKIEYLSIANILLDRPAWREFIQFEASPQKLADYVRECISEPAVRDKFASDAKELRSLLHAPQNMSAAKWFVSCLNK